MTAGFVTGNVGERARLICVIPVHVSLSGKGSEGMRPEIVALVCETALETVPMGIVGAKLSAATLPMPCSMKVLLTLRTPSKPAVRLHGPIGLALTVTPSYVNKFVTALKAQPVPESD